MPEHPFSTSRLQEAQILYRTNGNGRNVIALLGALIIKPGPSEGGGPRTGGGGGEPLRLSLKPLLTFYTVSTVHRAVMIAGTGPDYI